MCSRFILNNKKMVLKFAAFFHLFPYTRVYERLKESSAKYDYHEKIFGGLHNTIKMLPSIMHINTRFKCLFFLLQIYLLKFWLLVCGLHLFNLCAFFFVTTSILQFIAEFGIGHQFFEIRLCMHAFLFSRMWGAKCIFCCVCCMFTTLV